MFICKKTGELRVCIDYRSLNSNTIIDRYPIPPIDDTLDRLSICKNLQQDWFSKWLSPSWNAPWLSPQDCILNQIWPFWICGHATRPEKCTQNIPKTYKSIFQEDLDHFCTVYLDDILIYSFSTAEHLQHIEWVLSELRSNSLFAKPTKCEFDLTELDILRTYHLKWHCQAQS